MTTTTAGTTTPIEESEVMENVDIPSFEEFKMGEGEVVDLGSFLVETA